MINKNQSIWKKLINFAVFLVLLVVLNSAVNFGVFQKVDSHEGSSAVYVAQAAGNPVDAGLTDANIGLPEIVTTGGDAAAQARQVITFATNLIMSIATAVAILFIMISGFRLITAEGNDDVIKTQKKNLMWAVIGLGIVFIAGNVVPDIVRALRSGDAGQIGVLAGDLITNYAINTLYYIAAAVATLFIILSGFRMVTAGGNEEELKKQKSYLLWAVIGLVMVLLAKTGINEIKTILEKTPGADQTMGQLIGEGVSKLIQDYALATLYYIAAAVATLFIVISGFRLVTAGGNEEEIKKQKDYLLWAVLGLLIVLIAGTVVEKVYQVPAGLLADNFAETWGNNMSTFMKTTAISMVYRIAGAVAVIMIAITGLRMVVDGANEEAMKKHKTQLLWAVAGLVVIIASNVVVTQFFTAKNAIDLAGMGGGEAPTLEAVLYSGTGVQGIIPNLVSKLFVGGVLPAIYIIAGGMAVFMIIFSGIKLVTAGGNDEVIKKEKTALMWSIVGLLVIIAAAPMINKIIYNGAISDVLNNPASNILKGDDATQITTFQGYLYGDGSVTTQIGGLIQDTLIPGIRIILGALAVFIIVLSGFKLVTAGGNDEVIKKEKGNLMWSVIGLVVVLLSVPIVNLFYTKYLTTIQGGASGGAAGTYGFEQIDFTKMATDANVQIINTMNFFLVVVSTIAVAVIIYAGVRLVTAGGNEDAMKGAKNTLTYTTIGLILINLAMPIVAAVYGRVDKTSGEFTQGANISIAVSNVVGVTNFVLGILATLAVVMLIYGGVLYVTAMGNDSQTERARKILTEVVIGLIIIIVSYTVVNTVIAGKV